MRASSPGFNLNEEEMAAALWALNHNRPVGRGTDTLPYAHIRCEPLKTTQGVVGVLGIKPLDLSDIFSQDKRQLLDAYARLAALAIERAQLSEQANQARILNETEKLQSALLNSISHDLRTPLATITGAFSSLYEAESSQDQSIVLDHEDRLELMETGWGEARRLNRLVGNLLEITRLESGALKLNLQPADMEDVIGSSLNQMRLILQNHPLKINLPAERPLVNIDFVLIEQVFINLLENAAKYSPPDTAIEISVQVQPQALEVLIADHGQGISPEDLPHIFDKFYRAVLPGKVHGSGLGLSICKGIIEAHGGKIQAQNRPEGGALFIFSLPTE